MTTSRRILSAIMALLMCLSLVTTCFAVNAKDDHVNVIVNGEEVVFPDQKPITYNNRTLVPIRFIAEAMGYEVSWNPTDNTAVIDNGRIILYIGTDRAVIDGKEIVLDTKSLVISERTMVPLRVVSETLGCTVDWFSEDNTVRIISGIEISVWERLMRSGLFSVSNGKDCGYYGSAVLGDTFDTDIIPPWYIKRDTNMVKYCGDYYDFEIKVNSFDYNTLNDLYGMLVIIYPSGYEEVYELMLKSIKGELWETLRNDGGYLASGSWGTHYIDDREVSIYVNYGLTGMTITVNKIGYKNPETPLVLDDETITSLTEEAKKFYPLEEYGLN